MTLTQHLTIYKSLKRNKVKYLVVGGIAAISYGVPRNTLDIDIWIEPTLQNAVRFLSSLKEAKFGTAYLTTAKEILNNEITVFEDYLRLDVLTVVKGLEFGPAWRRRAVKRLDGIRTNLISLSDLIKSKLAIKRKIDIEDIKVLRQINRSK